MNMAFQTRGITEVFWILNRYPDSKITTHIYLIICKIGFTTNLKRSKKGVNMTSIMFLN